jgi:hypothetical protein
MTDPKRPMTTKEFERIQALQYSGQFVYQQLSEENHVLRERLNQAELDIALRDRIIANLRGVNPQPEWVTQWCPTCRGLNTNPDRHRHAG